MNSMDQHLRRWCSQLESGRGAKTEGWQKLDVSEVCLGESTRTGQTLESCFSIRLCSVSAVPKIAAAKSFQTLVCSRLGRDFGLHVQVGKYLMRSLWQAQRSGSVVLIATGSAIEPWAKRAAELTGTPLLSIGLEQAESSNDSDLLVRCPLRDPVTRDWVAIGMADHVDAVYVRRSGHIETCLVERIQRFGPKATRVAITSHRACAGTRLLQCGAVGWFIPDSESRKEVEAESGQTAQKKDPVRVSLSRSNGIPDPAAITNRAAGLIPTQQAWWEEPDAWLVHCTRGCSGPWPGETQRQYQDSILLGQSEHAQRRPLDTLCRIIGSEMLLASAVVTSPKYPVVCWSAVPLLSLLDRRCFRSHVQRWDYEPYGIAVRLEVAKRLGCQPVIYGQPRDRKKLAAGNQFLFQPIGKTNDWRREQEWRMRGNLDLSALSVRDLRVFAVDTASTRERFRRLPWPVTLLRCVKQSERGKTGRRGLLETWKAV